MIVVINQWIELRKKLRRNNEGRWDDRKNISIK